MEDIIWLAGFAIAFFVFWGFIYLFDKVIGPDEAALTEGEVVPVTSTPDSRMAA